MAEPPFQVKDQEIVAATGSETTSADDVGSSSLDNPTATAELMDTAVPATSAEAVYHNTQQHTKHGGFDRIHPPSSPSPPPSMTPPGHHATGQQATASGHVIHHQYGNTARVATRSATGNPTRNPMPAVTDNQQLQPQQGSDHCYGMPYQVDHNYGGGGESNGGGTEVTTTLVVGNSGNGVPNNAETATMRASAVSSSPTTGGVLGPDGGLVATHPAELSGMRIISSSGVRQTRPISQTSESDQGEFPIIEGLATYFGEEEIGHPEENSHQQSSGVQQGMVGDGNPQPNTVLSSINAPRRQTAPMLAARQSSSGGAAYRTVAGRPNMVSVDGIPYYQRYVTTSGGGGEQFPPSSNVSQGLVTIGGRTYVRHVAHGTGTFANQGQPPYVYRREGPTLAAAYHQQPSAGRFRGGVVSSGPIRTLRRVPTIRGGGAIRVGGGSFLGRQPGGPMFTSTPRVAAHSTGDIVYHHQATTPSSEHHFQTTSGHRLLPTDHYQVIAGGQTSAPLLTPSRGGGRPMIRGRGTVIPASLGLRSRRGGMPMSSNIISSPRVRQDSLQGRDSVEGALKTRSPDTSGAEEQGDFSKTTKSALLTEIQRKYSDLLDRPLASSRDVGAPTVGMRSVTRAPVSRPMPQQRLQQEGSPPSRGNDFNSGSAQIIQQISQQPPQQQQTMEVVASGMAGDMQMQTVGGGVVTHRSMRPTICPSPVFSSPLQTVVAAHHRAIPTSTTPIYEQMPPEHMVGAPPSIIRSRRPPLALGGTSTLRGTPVTSARFGGAVGRHRSPSMSPTKEAQIMDTIEQVLHQAMMSPPREEDNELPPPQMVSMHSQQLLHLQQQRLPPSSPPSRSRSRPKQQRTAPSAITAVPPMTVSPPMNKYSMTGQSPIYKMSHLDSISSNEKNESLGRMEGGSGDEDGGDISPGRVPHAAAQELSDSGEAEVSTEESTSTDSEGEWAGTDYITRCVCGLQHNDEFMIACDRCEVWQHCRCMGIMDRRRVPDNYLCENCHPRDLRFTPEQARELQQKKLGKWATDKERRRQQRQRRRDGKLKDRMKRREERKWLKAVQAGLAPPKRPGDFYTEIAQNEYSQDAKKFIEAQGDTSGQSLLENVSESSCQSMFVAQNKQGLVATHILPPDQPLADFRGKVWLKSEFNGRDKLGRMLPSCVLYSGFISTGEHDQSAVLCVDARQKGSQARFARRSCRANTQIKHVIKDGQIHFLIMSTELIDHSTEITIPWDFDIRTSRFPLECACGVEENSDESYCPILDYNHELKRMRKDAEKKRAVARKEKARIEAERRRLADQVARKVKADRKKANQLSKQAKDRQRKQQQLATRLTKAAMSAKKKLAANKKAKSAAKKAPAGIKLGLKRRGAAQSSSSGVSPPKRAAAMAAAKKTQTVGKKEEVKKEAEEDEKLAPSPIGRRTPAVKTETPASPAVKQEPRKRSSSNVVRAEIPKELRDYWQPATIELSAEPADVDSNWPLAADRTRNMSREDRKMKQLMESIKKKEMEEKRKAERKSLEKSGSEKSTPPAKSSAKKKTKAVSTSKKKTTKSKPSKWQKGEPSKKSSKQKKQKKPTSSASPRTRSRQAQEESSSSSEDSGDEHDDDDKRPEGGSGSGGGGASGGGGGTSSGGGGGGADGPTTRASARERAPPRKRWGGGGDQATKRGEVDVDDSEYPTATALATAATSTAVGSSPGGKKRWLRQAMSEEYGNAVKKEETISESTNQSQEDVVRKQDITPPLKKRRVEMDIDEASGSGADPVSAGDLEAAQLLAQFSRAAEHSPTVTPPIALSADGSSVSPPPDIESLSCQLRTAPVEHFPIPMQPQLQFPQPISILQMPPTMTFPTITQGRELSPTAPPQDPTPSVQTLPPPEPVKRKKVSLDEYKKRKVAGEGEPTTSKHPSNLNVTASGGGSFIPQITPSQLLESGRSHRLSSLPDPSQIGKGDDTLEELKRRIYGKHRGSEPKLDGMRNLPPPPPPSRPPPNRQDEKRPLSLEDRLRMEFGLNTEQNGASVAVSDSTDSSQIDPGTSVPEIPPPSAEIMAMLNRGSADPRTVQPSASGMAPNDPPIFSAYDSSYRNGSGGVAAYDGDDAASGGGRGYGPSKKGAPYSSRGYNRQQPRADFHRHRIQPAVVTGPRQLPPYHDHDTPSVDDSW